MIYNLKDYHLTYHSNKSERTVRRMLKSGLLPTNHKIVGNLSKQFSINVMSPTEYSEFYLEKLLLFNKRKSRTIQDAVAFCILHGVDDFQLFVKLANV